MNIPLLIATIVFVILAVLAAFFLLKSQFSGEKVYVSGNGRGSIILIIFICFLTVMSTIIPMGLSPAWNGEFSDHRDQYERMAEAIMEGHISFQYSDTDPRLLEMENPYDPKAREEAQVYYHWDHAFYNGHYYMYFGIVPVFLVFIPYRVLSGGNSLTTYHATQLFTIFFIVGIFALFRLLARKHFPRLSLKLYLLLSMTFSWVSVWYSVGTPSLYCTAINSAICLGVWSVYCFSKAVWDSKTQNKSILWATLGAFLGALEFGCRPPVGLSNILVLPLLWIFLKRNTVNGKLVGKLILVAIPYVVIAALLMYYNAVRFDNPFEFGQSYQLTNDDQSAYAGMASRFDLMALLSGIIYYYFNIMSGKNLISNGLFLTAPVLFSVFPCLKKKKNRQQLRDASLDIVIIAIILATIVIIAFDVLWAPGTMPRYRMDFVWLVTIAAFLILGISCQLPDSLKLIRWTAVLCFISMLFCVVLSLYPRESNFTAYYWQEITEMLLGR